MIRLIKFRAKNIRFSIKNNLQLVLFAAAAAGLLLLFTKAQPVDPDTHNAFSSNLRELQTRDTELGERVLQHRYQLLHNYDTVSAVMRRMQEIGVTLSQYQQIGWLPDTPEVRQELSIVQQMIALKSVALEQFKSNNAVIKNSFVHLPRMVNEVLSQLPVQDTLLRHKFESVLRDALLINLNSGNAARGLLQQDIGVIENAIVSLPDRVGASAKLVARHATLILENEHDMKDLLLRLSPIGKKHIGAELYFRYHAY